MSLKIDRAELEIVIKNDQSRKRMREIEDNMRRIRKEMKGMDESSPKFQSKLAELKKAQAEYDQLTNKIGLAGLSMKELRNRQRELNAVLAQIPGNSPLYEKYSKQLKEVNQRMAELRGTARATEGSLSKLANGFNKYFAMAASAMATITGLSMTFRRLAEDVAKMDDVYSDVMKTTGMTRDQVLELNEEFKKMDTRTSREELNLLARDAGKLGLSSKKDIMDFVDAGNQIRVALGEDLGEDAIKSIGKMVGVFKKSSDELQGLDLKGEMLAAASAVNELGASSTANEKYLVQFAGRLGGVASQAGISMSAILGFASSLDQDMQAVEMSATALQKFIMSIMADPAKFAKIAGQDVKEFSELLNTDANEAIKQVLRSLNEKGGFQQLIPIFKDMGLDGARAVGVLSSLAGSIDQVEEAQSIANLAMLEGTSATKEYNIKNENLQAQLEKARKAFKETAFELGQSLNPILLKSTKATTYLIKALVELPKWLKENKGLIFTLVTVMSTYVVLVNRARIANLALVASEKLRVFWSKAVVAGTQLQIAVTGYLTGSTRAANLATKQLFATLRLNPYVAVGVALAGLTIGLYKLITANDKGVDSVKAMNDINEEAIKNTRQEIIEIDLLKKTLNSNTASYESKKRALDKLKEIVPDYHASLTAEGKLINNNSKAISAYTKQLVLNEKIKIAASKMADADAEISAFVEKYEKDLKALAVATVEAQEMVNVGRAQSVEQALATMGFGGAGTKALISMRDGLQKNKKAYSDMIDEYRKELEKEGVKIQEITIPTPGGDGVDVDEKDQVKELDRQLAAETLRLKENYTTHEKYEEDLLALTQKYTEKKRDVYAKNTAEWLGYQIQLEDIRLNNLKKQQDLELEVINDSNQAVLDSLEQLEIAKKENLQSDLEDEIITREQYNSDLAALEVTLAEARLKNAKDYLELISNATFDSEKEKKKAIKDAQKAITAAEKEGLKAQAKDQKTKEQQEKDHQNEIARLRRELGLDKEKLLYKEGLEALKEKLKEAEASEKETAQAINDYKLEMLAKYADVAAKISSQVSNAVSGFENAAITKTETRYNKQIAAAKKAGQDTTEIEEKKEEEVARVRAQYADAKFVVQIAQIGAETAFAAISAFRNGMQMGGPILAGVLAGVATIYGLSQIANAKAERDAAKAGYFKGGYTGGSSPDEIRGYFPDGQPYHGGEFVANHKAVRNPHVKKFLDVFNDAQLKGNVHLLNTTQILDRVRTESSSSGYKSGGYTEAQKPDTTGSDMLMMVVTQLAQATNRLTNQLEDGITAKAVISGRDGIAEQTKKYNRYIKNASRK